ncbi:MAG: hypothetical protein IJJ41_03635 [Clostridia bacterium]|nr:hypothetical protein [Clostridia bacterium]
MKEKISRSTIKKIIASVLFVVFGIGLLGIASFCFTPERFHTDSVKDVKPYGVLAEPENTLDAVIFGDSEAFSAFSPVQMWQEHGFTSYVCSSASQYISLTESFVRQTLEHQKPKVIFLETNAIYRKMNTDNPTLAEAEKIFPVFQYHNLWKNLDPAGINENEDDYCWQDDLKGFKYIDIINPSRNPDYMKKTKAVKKVPGSNLTHVTNIYNLCKESGVELVLVSAPSTINWNYAKHNMMVKLSKQLGVKYIDLNVEKLGLNWNHDTCDRGDHVNYFGATKVSKFFGDYAAKTFSLPDRRKDSAYSDWNALKEKYDDVTARSKTK